MGRISWFKSSREPSGSRSVLFVDDDRAIRALAEAGLAEFGFHVISAKDVRAAKELLRTREFAVVVSDYEMPGETGLDLLRFVTRVYPHLPFIILTGRATIDLGRDSVREGALDFLSKPFRVPDLVRHIEQGWARIDRERERIQTATDHLLAGAARALVAAIDAKDPYTAQHSKRVTELALRLGDAAGLDAAHRRMIEYAGLLHDVGKIAVPGSVLRKPGALNEAEWVLVKQHPVRSAEIVGAVETMSEVATVVRHHHERLNGSGYPDGLTGDAIHPLARLLAITDVYEALTSSRAYRPAMSPEEARRILREGWGTQFDADLGRAFESIENLP